MRSDQNSNSSILLCMSWLPTRMKKIKLKMNALKWTRHYRAIFKHSRAANSIVGGQVWPIIKLSKALIVVLDTYKNDEDPSKTK